MCLPFFFTLVAFLGIIASLQPAIALAGHPQPHDGCTGLSSSPSSWKNVCCTTTDAKTTRKPAHEDGVTGWHPHKLDYRALSIVKILQPGRLFVVMHSDFCEDDSPTLVLAKTADMDLPSDRQSMAHEVAMYQHLDGTGITPDFLGHIIDEAGLAIGFLLEYIVSENEANQGRRQRMQACMTVLQRLHNDHGIAHGDTHDGNCLVRKDGSAVLIDFELAEKNAPEAELARDKSIMDRCIRSLPDEDMTSQAL